ncbi:MAG: amino acid permease [Candidatus Marinimicrobia bacterium]|nr:amino acid permease [Candidatus Neomarinimicrobiota bacterium]
MTELKRVLGVRDIVLMNIAAIVGLRWLLTASRTGPPATVLWIMALLFFFIPQALAVIELTTRYPKQGGVYIWAQKAFGPKHGFIAGWCYWATNVIYFPSLLIFLGSNAIFIFGSRFLGLEANPIYIALFSLGVLWTILFLNVLGLNIGKWIQNAGGFGQWTPVIIIMGAGLYALFTEGSATTFTVINIWPDFARPSTIAFWATMCFGFAGLELAPILSEEIKDPRRTLPRAIVISGIMITIIYIFGTLSLQWTMSSENVSILEGVPQAVSRLFAGTGWVWLGALAAFAITAGGTGGVSAWLSGSARIPYASGLDHYLPPAFSRLHPRYGTPHVSLVWMAALSSIFILMSVVGSTIKEAYIVLVDATLILYFIPYLYMFTSVLILRNREGLSNGIIPMPGGKLGLYLFPILGLLSTLVSIAFSLIPPEDVASPALFLAKVVGGTGFFVVIGWGLYRHYSQNAQNA